jgi:hypothetical protein
MARRASASEKKAHDLVRRRYEHAKSYWSTQNDLYPRLMDFCLDLGHYRQSDSFSRDRRRIQPKTQRQFNLIRHKASLLLRQAPQFDTHAVQPGADSAAAEVSRRIIENIFNDPLKAYHDPRSRMVWSALAGGRGCMAVDWHPKWGVCFRFVDPRRLHITPGFTFLHDPRNPCVLEEVPMRLSEVRKMKGWDVPDDLTGDGGVDLPHGGSKDADGLERDQAQHWPGTDENDAADPLVTICKAWFREDPFQNSVKAVRDASLPEDEWFFVDDQTQLRLPFDPMNPVPPVSPETGAPMRLVTRKDEMQDYESEAGYLIITAPFYQGSRPLFEGGWLEGALNDQAVMPAFPYAEMVGYRHPLRRTGISDTELTHSLTMVDNSTFRSTYEQTTQAGGIFIQPPGGLKDSEGNQFRLTSDPINFAYVTDPMAKEMVDFKQFPGMNPTMPQFRDMIEGQWQHIGTGDFGGSLGPDRSKDIAVGTANLIQQTGDLPVQLHAQDLGLQEAILATVVLAYCSAYMGDQVVSWVTDNGDVAYANVRGSDLVPLNVAVKTDKEWRQQDIDRVQATAQLLGMIGKMGLPPAATAALLKDAGMSPTVVSALTEAMNAPMAGGQPGPPANGAPPQMGAPPPAISGANPEVSGAVPQ